MQASSSVEHTNLESAAAGGGSNETHARIAHVCGPPQVDPEALQLVERLRDGDALSTPQLARSLGLTEQCLRSLVAVFSRIGQQPREYSVTLFVPGSGTPQQVCFGGTQTTCIEDGRDGKRLKEQFKANGLTYRRDHPIQGIGERFATWSPSRQRREFDARFGDERDKLPPSALQVWFWDPGITGDALAARVALLVGQGKPMPAPSAEIDAGGFAQSFGSAGAALLASQRFADGSPERDFLTALNEACARGLSTQAVADAIDSQSARLKQEADKAAAAAQVKAVRVWAEATVLRIAPDEMPPSSCQGLIDAICGYPTKESWRGNRRCLQTDAAAAEAVVKGVIQEASDCYEKHVRFLKEHMPKAPALGRIPKFEELETRTSREIDRIGERVQNTIRTTIAESKYGIYATAVLNAWVRAGFSVLETRAALAGNFYSTGFIPSYRTVMAAVEAGQQSDAEEAALGKEMTRLAPEILKTDLMPRVRMWRDLFEAIDRARSSVPASVLPAMNEKSAAVFRTVYLNRVTDLNKYWSMEMHALKDEWVFNPWAGKNNSRFQVDFALKASGHKIECAGGFAKAEGLSANLGGMHAYAWAQLVALNFMCRCRRNPDMTAAKLRAAYQNVEFAAKGLRELSQAYSYLLECAGEGIEKDWVLSALERKVCILETAALAARVIEPVFKITGSEQEAAEPVPPREGCADEEIYIPVSNDLRQFADDNEAQVEGGTVGQLETPAALGDAGLEQQLNAAREHLAQGRRMFLRIDGSPSQNNNVHLAVGARAEFRLAREGFQQVLASVRSTTQPLPKGVSQPQKIEKEAVNAGTWTLLMDNLLGSQLDRLLYPTADNAVARLFQAKALQVRRPPTFVHQLQHVDPQTGKKVREQLVELEVRVMAEAISRQTGTRKEPVQTMLLHCHVGPEVRIRTCDDLRNIKDTDIRAAHLKPLFFRMLTNRTAGASVTEQSDLHTKHVPYARVPSSIVKNWLATASRLK